MYNSLIKTRAFLIHYKNRLFSFVFRAEKQKNVIKANRGGSCMKKLEMIIKSEKLEDLKVILDDCNATGVMITNIMGYGNQKGYKQVYRGTEYNVNLLPKVKVETVTSDEIAEDIITKVLEQINTGNYGDGKIFVYDVEDAVRIRTGERGAEAL